ITTSSGEESLVLLENNKVDLIILNNITSDLDAIHILQYIKLNTDLSDIPVIILNDHMDDFFVKKCINFGATEFIRKPVIDVMLKNRVKLLLNYKNLEKSFQKQISNEHKILEEQLSKNKLLIQEMAAALAKTIDAKDRYTSGHSERVAHYSVMISKRAGLDKLELEKIYYMGLLHDIGKIGVPSHIINSSKRLTTEEFETIKSHTIIGASILQGIDVFPELAIGAHYHHERYDGHGYPQGLKGDYIPKLARIIAIADAYDAMTSERSYRPSLTQDKVYQEIEKGIGSQFDPTYAKIMLKIMEEDSNFQLRESRFNPS
ncbi:MAG: HD domain-containing protein, partial [Desulfovibrionaceae bacterium]|nr:HD domain-containing protein [Desulfovibrionaceae bacterium]